MHETEEQVRARLADWQKKEQRNGAFAVGLILYPPVPLTIAGFYWQIFVGPHWLATAAHWVGGVWAILALLVLFAMIFHHRGW